MRRTFLYKAQVNRATEANALEWLERCRELYNACLEQRILAYRRRGKSFSFYEQKLQLKDIRAEFSEFNVVNHHVEQNVCRRVDSAFQAFFRRSKLGKAGFPRFKGRNRYDSFTLDYAKRTDAFRGNGWKLEGRNLHITNLGRFKLFIDRPIQGDIKTVTIRRSSTGTWWVSFSCDNVPVREFPETDKSVGIDVGIESFCTDSDGNRFENPKHFDSAKKLLRRRQRSLCRKVKGSNRRNKARILVAKAHEKVVSKRRDFLHKVSKYYVDNYKEIHVEDLNIQGMVKNRHLSRAISDVGWGMFFNFLSYKAEEAGRTVVKVPPHGTSQICSSCGEKVPKKLSERMHCCPYCGLVLHRDHNAAINILNLNKQGEDIAFGR